MKRCYVYILTNRSGTLYTGITSDLMKRLYQHRHKMFRGFTSRYRIDRLVWYEVFDDPSLAIAREKQIKRWRREKKVALIEAMNRDWKDLSAPWYEDAASIPGLEGDAGEGPTEGAAPSR